MSQQTELVEISGLWKNEDKNGNVYLTGYLGSAVIKIFVNQFKENDKHPDFKMYVTRPKKTEDQGNNEQRSKVRL